MPRPVSWLALAVAAGLVLPLAAQQGKGKGKDKKPPEGPAMKVESGETPTGRSAWKPGFDYTHLPPANEQLWEPVSKAAVEMEQALGVAAEVLGGPVWLHKAWMGEHEGQSAWRLQVFTSQAGSEEPRRVDLAIGAAEPRVLGREDLPALSEKERLVWNSLGKASVQAEAVIALCKVNMRGEKPEPEVTEPHMRLLEFVPAEQPFWTCEMMGIERAIPRRYGIDVKSNKPVLRQRILLDRFPGTPLRRDKPTELPSGMFLFDFTTGDGQAVTKESKVKVHYRLFLLDNTKLHDTWQNNLPETFLVTEAPLKGMTEGLVGMRVGGKRKIAMPYELAFGERGNEIVPEKAMVVCDVTVEELVSQ